jgi:uncharacterized surface protein with fasciclin (FAS1) repeats
MIVAALLTVILIGAVATPSAAAPAQAGCSGAIVAVAVCVNQQTGEFDTLIAALSTAGLVDALNGGGQFTVFAPTDAAFAKLGITPQNVGTLDVKVLSNILLYHVAAGERFANSFTRPTFLKMLNNKYTLVYRFFNRVFVAHSRGIARVVAGNMDATNGVIHVVDQVLIPPR